MIKNNEATECGVTNGAETIIVGWKSENINTFSQYGMALPCEIQYWRSSNAVTDPGAPSDSGAGEQSQIRALVAGAKSDSV